MCGIIGVFNNKNSVTYVNKGLRILKNRGKDGFGVAGDGFFSNKLDSKLKAEHCIGHSLHSVVGFLQQPIKGRGLFAANCEVYNWKELDKEFGFNSKNDSELIFKIIDKFGVEEHILKRLDGVYAFVYWLGGKVYLCRDILGVKPVWFSHSKGFAFASEKKALEKIGYIDVQELNPRRILCYDINKDKISFSSREFFKIKPVNKKSMEDIEKELIGLITCAISKRIPDKEFGILFSGGIDSTLIAFMCKKLGLNPVCYTAALSEPGMEEASDLKHAKKIAEVLGLKLKIKTINVKQVEKYLEKIVPLIEDTKVTKVGVALTLFLALEQAKKDNVKVIFSGLGSEEIFAGYERHKKSHDINQECLSGLIKLYERDLYRDDVISMYNSIELRLPFLDKRLVDYSLKIPGMYKVDDNRGKIILREVAAALGLPREFAERKKVAAQYGSKFIRAIKKLTKKSKLKYMSDYLRRFYTQKNLKLGALISTGKDSLFAAYVMQQQNYEVGCLISVYSKNPASYMFHTPNIKLVKLQAEAMELPLVAQETEGLKEKELVDLKKALKRAKKEHKIDGVVTGALYSTYQRDRIEKIADSLGLKIFSPLWHINQETEMREIIRQGFEVIIVAVAAEGLGKKDLGVVIGDKFIDRMVKLNEKIGVNVAGEGGEFESLVLDCPMFHKKIKIEKAEVVMDKENSGVYVVKRAKLVRK
ncbi:diphthine--ammonia ligase [Candidatus Woesearchaeota archaeon]|nr:diphthine--ammonia ligase [Candidatus Woesearchaeota archaeon]